MNWHEGAGLYVFSMSLLFLCCFWRFRIKVVSGTANVVSFF